MLAINKNKISASLSSFWEWNAQFPVLLLILRAHCEGWSASVSLSGEVLPQDKVLKALSMFKGILKPWSLWMNRVVNISLLVSCSQDSGRSVCSGSRRAAASLSYAHVGTPALPRDLGGHEPRDGLRPGAGVARGPQLPHRLQPLPQNSIWDQIPHPEDPPRAESVSLGEI